MNFPSSFFESGKKYICRANGSRIVITADSTGKDQLSYDVDSREFTVLRRVAWATPTHRAELESAFMAAYLALPVADAPDVNTNTVPVPVTKTEQITVTWNDKSEGYRKGEIFENAPGQFLRVVSITRRYISEDGYSQGLGADEGNLYTAVCIPATQEAFAAQPKEEPFYPVGYWDGLSRRNA